METHRLAGRSLLQNRWIAAVPVVRSAEQGDALADHVAALLQDTAFIAMPMGYARRVASRRQLHHDTHMSRGDCVPIVMT